MAGIYKTWRMECDTCKGRFNYLNWNYQVPRECACGGKLNTAPGEMLLEYPDFVPESPRVRTSDPNIILKDIEVLDERLA
jgi:hypothetical protein